MRTSGQFLDGLGLEAVRGDDVIRFGGETDEFAFSQRLYGAMDDIARIFAMVQVDDLWHVGNVGQGVDEGPWDKTPGRGARRHPALWEV